MFRLEKEQNTLVVHDARIVLFLDNAVVDGVLLVNLVMLKHLEHVFADAFIMFLGILSVCHQTYALYNESILTLQILFKHNNLMLPRSSTAPAIIRRWIPLEFSKDVANYDTMMKKMVKRDDSSVKNKNNGHLFQNKKLF